MEIKFIMRLIMGLSLCASFMHSRQAQVTVQNKSTEAIQVSLGLQQSKPTEKHLIKPRQSKKFMLQPLSHAQSYILVVETGSSYWPKKFEIASMNKQEIILKRDSMILSRKVIKKADNCAQAPLHIVYNANSYGQQEIALLNQKKKRRQN